MALDLYASLPRLSFVGFDSCNGSNTAGRRRKLSALSSSFSGFSRGSSYNDPYLWENASFSGKFIVKTLSSRRISLIPKGIGASSSGGNNEDVGSSSDKNKTPFGYTRKDVLLIGVGITVFGVGLKNGLEFLGVDPLQAGNVVQLVIVLGLTLGWISTYIFRVSTKDMTYIQQLRDYENKVMEKRLEGLTEAELEVLLQQVEEENERIAAKKQSQ